MLTVFTARTITIIQRGFIDFVQGREKNFTGPVALMGGIIDKPFLLILYFVRIAFFNVWLHARSVSPLEIPKAMVDSICVLYSAAQILVPAVVDELRS